MLPSKAASIFADRNIYATDFDIPGHKAIIHTESEVKNDSKEAHSFNYQVTVTDINGKVIKTFDGPRTTLQPDKTGIVKAEAPTSGLHFWNWGYGYLYTVKTALLDYSYPFHKEGDSPLYKKQPASDYNHNQDMLAVEMVRRWYDYWRERPGTGLRVSSGGTKIIFSDSNTHYRGAENYRRSGVTDPMRIEKDAFFAHQVMWNGLEAVSYDSKGHEASRYTLETAGEPASLKLTALQNPEVFHADGADMALLQIEVVDKEGRRCPLDNRIIHFTLEGEAEWRGGIAQGPNNHILDTNLPVECGINRALIRSTTKAGKIVVTAQAEGLPSASLTMKTVLVKVVDGCSEYLPQYTLKCRLDKGETPQTPSYTDTKRDVAIVSAAASANTEAVTLGYDDNELSEWSNDGLLTTAWITYKLARKALVDDICIKLNGWRSRSYPLEVYAEDNTLLWSGNTEKSLGYIHLEINKPVLTDRITIRLKGSTSDKAAFGQIVEVAGGVANDMEKKAKAGKSKNSLRIIEVEFLESIK